MSDYLQKIITLTKAQYDSLITNGSLTYSGGTITYNPNNIYLTTDENITTADLGDVVVPVSKGGTGRTSVTQGSVLVGNVQGLPLGELAATNANTANTLVKRDSSGSFDAQSLNLAGVLTAGTLDGDQHIINGNVQLNAKSGSYNEGLRINRSTTGYANIYLGAARNSASSSQTGGWWIGTLSTPANATATGSTITNTVFTISQDSTDDGFSIKGTRGATRVTNSGWAIRPRLAVGTTYQTGYNFYVNGTSYFSDAINIPAQSAAYTKGIQFMSSSTKKGSFGCDTAGTIVVYGSKVCLRPVLDAATDGVEITTTNMIPTKNATVALGASDHTWSYIYLSTDGNAQTGKGIDFYNSTTHSSHIGTNSSNMLGIYATGGIAIRPSLSASDCGIKITNATLEPGKTNTISLGTSSLKWSNVYATTFTGDLSGNADSATTATIANALKNINANTGSGNRPTDVNTAITHVNNGGVQHIKIADSTNSVTGHLLHFHWDTGDSWDGQLLLPNNSNNSSMKWRSCSAANTWDSWRTLLDSSNYTNYTVTKTGTGASGSWGISITGTSSYTTTTADTTNTLYLTGVTSDATTTLKRNSKISMTGSTLEAQYISLVGDHASVIKKMDSYTGGWARSIIQVKDSSSTEIVKIGILGNADTLSYMYIGSNDYNGNNLRIYPSGTVTIPADTDASSTSTGSLQVGGGVGIAKKLYVGSTIVAEGQIKTSFKDSIAPGSYQSSQTTIPNLLEEVRYSSGCMGSFNLTTAYSLNNLTLATGWYNFMYIPHRSGGVNGAAPASADNCDYGVLYLHKMNFGQHSDYILSYNNKAISLLDLHASFKSAITDEQIVIADGTTGHIKTSGYTTSSFAPSSTVSCTAANVKTALSISSSGSATKWLNEKGSWTTPTASDVGAAPSSTVSCTAANVKSALGIKSNGSITKWLNESGGWTTPTASDIGAAPAVTGGYLPLSGGTMTGQITLHSTGYKTSNTSGYSVDQYGNFKHQTTTAANVFEIQKNNGTATFKVTYESGEVAAAKYVVDAKVRLEYNTTDDSLDFVFI